MRMPFSVPAPEGVTGIVRFNSVHLEGGPDCSQELLFLATSGPFSVF
jgi:hypothetical protein